ncbi:protein of unknown function [Methylacidimicrobium sp. AP8]|uniref:hypothetical protein n=1 Tax=Methylacidimicrobium sp. AP8 TaxID=2730359 RepID=UPI0018BFB923|nr:hypothetical protein [Methylacidimicrobium sp. AP8]CAB4243508.1 protein of unknown function [Methylacidimicrobium sp. AP8]
MSGNPKWPPDDDGNRRWMRHTFLLCLLLFFLSVIQFAIGLLVALGIRIYPI